MSPTPTRSTTGLSPAPVVHLHQPQSATPPWQAVAVFAMLTLQLLLGGLVAWRLLAPPTAAQDNPVAAALDKLNAALATAEARRGAELAETRTKARAEFLDEAFRELKNADEGAISRLQTRFDQSNRLAEDIAARDAQIRELRGMIEETRGKVQTLEATAKREQQRLQLAADELKAENGRLQADLKNKEAELARFVAKVEPTASSEERADAISPSRTWWWLAGGALVVMVVAAGCWWIGSRGGLPLQTVNAAAEAKQA